MPAAVAIPLIVAAASAGGSVAAAKMQSSAAGKAAGLQTNAANHAADVQGQSANEALAFTKQQAENDARNSESTRRANYDQWAAREQRLGSVGQALGYGGRTIPAYVPTTDPQFTAPQPTAQAPRMADPRLGNVGSYLTPHVAPGVTLPDPYTLRPVGAYL